MTKEYPMRALVLSFALIATPAVAQSGPQLLPQLSLDKAGSSRTISVRDPVSNTNRPIGTIDSSGFNSTVQRSLVGARGWLEAMIPGTESIAQAQSISTRGFIGSLGACRTSDSTQTGSQGCQGVSGFAINNNTAQLQSVYAGYLEARRYAGAGITQGLEVNPLNGGSTVDESPYAMNQAGITEALRASAGRTDTLLNNPVSAALVIVNNGATFRRGIICSARALDPAGPNDCLAMASGHRITWYTGMGTMVGGTVYSGVGASGTSGEVDLAAISSTNVAVRCSLMGFGHNSLACESGLDLGLSGYRFNRVYASYINTTGLAPTGSSRTPCTVGDQATDANYIYICTSPNHWKRAALSDY